MKKVVPFVLLFFLLLVLGFVTWNTRSLLVYTFQNKDGNSEVADENDKSSENDQLQDDQTENFNELVKDCTKNDGAASFENSPMTFFPNETNEIFGMIIGSWCFEGDCSVNFFDQQGYKIPGTWSIWVDSWTEDNKVSCTGKIMFDPVVPAGTYSLVIMADNPSGLKEHCEYYTESISVQTRN